MSDYNMSINDFEFGSKSSLDSAINSTLEETSSSPKIQHTLRTACLKSVSQVIKQVSEDKFEVVLAANSRNLTASKAARMLKSSDSNIYDVTYDEDLENSDLINKSEKALWNVSKSGNSLIIQRVK